MTLRTRYAALENLLVVLAEMAARPISVSAPGAPHRAALLVAPGFVEALAAAKDAKRDSLESEIASLQNDKTTLLLVLSSTLARLERIARRVATAKYLYRVLTGDVEAPNDALDEAIESLGDVLGGILGDTLSTQEDEKEIAANVERTIASLFDNGSDDDRHNESGLALEQTRDLTEEG